MKAPLSFMIALKSKAASFKCEWDRKLLPLSVGLDATVVHVVRVCCVVACELCNFLWIFYNSFINMEINFLECEMQRLRAELAQTKEVLTLREVQISSLLTVLKRCVFLSLRLLTFWLRTKVSYPPRNFQYVNWIFILKRVLTIWSYEEENLF